MKTIQKKVKRIAVLTSGGDAPGMNAAIRAVVRKAKNEGLKVFGIYEGFKGLCQGNIKELHPNDVSGIIQRPGTMLLTSRYPEFQDKKIREIAINYLKSFQIDALVVIGGNGSYQGAKLLAEESEISVITIPATIDNDINGTDLTIGFSSCLKVISRTINDIRATSGSHSRIFAVQVMGRNAGDLALHAGIACGAESILIPEETFSLKKVVQQLQSAQKSNKSHSIIIVAEGVMTVEELAEKLKKQNIDCYIDSCGYAQRGGAPTTEDRVLASRMGHMSVELILQGSSNQAVSLHGSIIAATPLQDAIQRKTSLDRSLLAMTEELSNY